jgi:hypothetical protein
LVKFQNVGVVYQFSKIAGSRIWKSFIDRYLRNRESEDRENIEE